jgi:hypothetical protein
VAHGIADGLALEIVPRLKSTHAHERIFPLYPDCRAGFDCTDVSDFKVRRLRTLS